MFYGNDSEEPFINAEGSPQWEVRFEFGEIPYAVGEIFIHSSRRQNEDTANQYLLQDAKRHLIDRPVA